MIRRGKWLQALVPVDALIIVFLCLLGVYLIFMSRMIHEWMFIVLANIAGSLAIVLLARLAQSPDKRFIRFLHNWYPAPIIFIVFKEVYVVMQSLGLKDWDGLLIACDRYIFHADPTIWLMKFSSPPVTELLQLAYVSYYILMMTLGVELYLRKEYQKFSFTIFTITFGFLLSYIGYMFFPAVGPRFTLHAFDGLNTELPGVFLTNYLRDFINSGESIPQHIANPIAFAQRDAFPSGHTQMTLIVIYLAHKFRISSRWWLYIFGTLLIISTVYLRYHYVTDLLGGTIFMIFTVWTAPKLVSWWNKLIHPTPV
jgi:membrane-associated phospholipid phosphatase